MSPTVLSFVQQIGEAQMPIIHSHTYRLLKQILEHADKVVIVSVTQEDEKQMTYTYVKRKQTEKGERR
jgi:hypothetical protein